MDASKKAEDFFATESKKLDEKLVETYKKAGVKVVEMTDEQANKWRDVANKSSYRTFANKVPGGKELIVKAQIGRAHVCTPVTNAHLVCRLLLEKKNTES